MILTSNTDLKKYVSIAASFEFTDFEPYIQKAVNAYTHKYVGNLHVTLDAEATGDNATVKNEAREYLRSAIANFGMYIFMPLLQVQLDSSGISVNTNENRKSPEWWQTKDIRRELLRSGHESMDLLLAVLDANPAVFTDYTTNYASINNELLVNNATVFSKYYTIFDSRQTFLALSPVIRKVEDQYLHTFLCPELITALKGTVTNNVKLVKEAMQKAIVSFTVAKVSTNGLFVFDERGLRIDFENMNDGRRENPSSGKSVDQLKALADEEISNGTQYLNQVVEIIEANPASFTQCTYPLLKNSKTLPGYKPYNTQGVYGL
ncbi:MAG: hypothetical protein RJA53_1953 [Bacteroidota bacterium]|jgi:hypothetical protein